MKLEQKAEQRQVGAEQLESFFYAYLRNKIMIFLLMVRDPSVAAGHLSVEKQKAFFHDLYHHFLPQNVPMKYHHAFKWIGLFLDRYPDLGPVRIDRAMDMAGLVCEVFGENLNRYVGIEKFERNRILFHRRKEAGHVSEKPV